jgi:hypothetical protein
MLRKDLIMRQFEEFGKVLSQILSFKREKDWEEFEKEVQKAFNQFTSLELEHIELLNESDFETEVIKHPTLSFEQKKIMAALLFEKMNYYLEQNRDEYPMLKSKCIKLYSHIRDNFTENQFDMDVHYKLEFLKNL